MEFNRIRLPKNKLIIVPCCRECNSIAGSKIFASFYEKREFIQKRIEGLYWDILKYPDWEDEELKELAGSTLQDVKISILQKRVTLERISFSAEIFPVREPSISEIAC